MRRRVLFGAGLVCVSAAALLPLERAPTATTPAAAFATGLGGLRVALADVLYLRADALRRAGDPEGAREGYEALLEMDPEDVAAVGFLADLFVDDLLGRTEDVDEQLALWEAARAELRRGIALRPEAARLHFKLAWLHLEWDLRFPRLAPRLEQQIPRAVQRERLEAHLMEAAELTDNIPGLGRVHLRLLSTILPIHAAEALVEDDAVAYERAVRAAHRLLRLRTSALREMLPYDAPPGAPQADLATVTRVAFERITGFARALAARDLDAARGELDAWARFAGPEEPLVGLLRRYLG